MKYTLIGLVALLLVPFVADAQFGPIVPAICQQCPCGFGGVLAIIQNLMNFVIGIAVIFATIIIVWGGILYVLSPTNPEHRGTANKMLLNAFIGLCIVLSSWLIVDFVMKTLYGGQFGPWNSILINGAGGSCIEENENVKPLFEGEIVATPGQNYDAYSHESVSTTGNCPVPAESGMVPFPAEATSGSARKATPQTVQNFMAMREEAKKAGIDLKVTSAYRSEEQQVALWNQLKGSGKAVAVPCTQGGNGSNHNSGTAIDISVGCGNGVTNCNTKTYRWLKENGSRWGFRNEIPNDPVHWSPSGR
jgi:hypothetical protein